MHKIAKLLAGAAISLTALALPATAALAQTGPPQGGNTWQPPKGGNQGGNNDPQGNNWGGQDKNRGCTDSWGKNRGGITFESKDNQGSWSNSCDPKPPVCKDMVTWGWIPWMTQGRGGDFRRGEIWGKTDHNNCGHPVAPPCRCTPERIIFQFSTYGDWLKDLYGPALHNGETVTYRGQTWTVEDWTLNAHGSQGTGTYFVLRHFGTSLESPGTPNDPAHDVNGVAYTICNNHLPLTRI
jgi:hypothetical protein